MHKSLRPAAQTSLWLSPIDGLRALAALSVVFQHANYPSIERLLPLANLAVALFFCISGFLLFFLFEGEAAKTQRISVRNYFRRRVYRIWPLYFTVIAIGFVISIFNSDVSSQLSQYFQLLTFSSNFWMTAFQPWPPNILAQLWSIGPEEHLYIIAPLLFLLHRRYPNFLVFAVPILVATFMRIYCAAVTLPHETIYGGIYFGTYSFVDIFLGGAIAAHFYVRRNEFNNHALFRILTVPSALWIYVACLFVVGLVWTSSIFPPYRWYSPFIYNVLSVIFSLLLLNVIVNADCAPARALSSRPMHILGTLSYSIYAIHLAAIDVVGRLSPRPPGISGTVVYNLEVFVTVLVFSGLLYFAVERPFLMLKARRTAAGNFSKQASYWPTILIIGLVGTGVVSYLVRYPG